MSECSPDCRWIPRLDPVNETLIDGLEVALASREVGAVRDFLRIEWHNGRSMRLEVDSLFSETQLLAHLQV